MLLQQNPRLRDLDLAGNSCLPDRLLHAASLAAACSGLRTLDLSGCELVAPGGYLTDAFPALQRLDISNTAVTDADVQALAAELAALESLALRGCRRVSAGFFARYSVQTPAATRAWHRAACKCFGASVWPIVPGCCCCCCPLDEPNN